jgi:hypothetical protein
VDSNGLTHVEQSATHGTTLGNNFFPFVDDSDLFAWIMQLGGLDEQAVGKGASSATTWSIKYM